MSGNMTVFFVERTGHVLGAVTRAAGAGQVSRKGPIQEDVLTELTLVGSASLPSVSLQFLVPGKELSTLVVDPLPELLLQPLSFHAPKEVDAQGIEQRPKEVKQLPGRVPTVNIDAREVKVELSGTGGPILVNAWVMVAGGALKAPLIVTGSAKEPGPTSFALPRLDPGTYRVLVLVAGWSPFAGSKSFP